MERDRGRERGRSTRGGGRGNAENPNRPHNPWFSSGRPVQNPGSPAPPRGNPWQNPGNPPPQRGNPPQNPGNPPRQRGNPPQNPGANPWQTPGNQAAPRPNPRGEGRGSSSGQRGGRGWGTDYVPRAPGPDPMPSVHQSTKPPVQEIKDLKLSSPTTSKTPSDEPARFPMTRPDAGGRNSMRRIELFVNHFKVEFKPNFTILHYDVDIKLEKPPKPNSVVRISKSDAVSVRNKLFSEELSMLPISKTAYDGEKNIYSAVELPTGKFMVTISKGEDTRPRTYIVSLNLVNKLELQVLDAYLKGRGQSVPRDVLQGMDIIMRENPSRTQITMGRGFYSKSPEHSHNIGDGIIACTGSQQSLKSTSQGVSLCVDYTVMPFRKPVPVLHFLQENLNIHFDKRMTLNNNIIGKVERALKGLKVSVTHRNTTQKFPVMGLTRASTSRITFDLEDTDNANSKRKVALVDYFAEKYNQDIEFKNLPCLDLSKGKRINYVPLEFCVLVEGQRYPKDDLSNYADKNLREMSLVRPMERKQLICDIVNSVSDGPCGGEIARQFGIMVSMTMTRVTSRVLNPPALKLRGANDDCSVLTPEGSCQYNLLNHKVVDGKDIIRWGILDFSQHWSMKRYTPLDVDRFTRAFVQRSRKLGIRMENYLFYEQSSMDIFSNAKDLSNLLKHVHHDLAKGHLQILFCPMTEKHQGYKTLKRICETEIGIMTQCCLSYLANKCQDQYLANIALKMNAKVGGSNMELYEQLPNLVGDGHVMFIGADVNHPTAGQHGLSPSITAVVATMNYPGANRYASRVCAQPRAEKIHHIGEMCSELIEAYARINEVKPERIIFFRDGVSETQFDMVLNEELTEIRRAIESDGYKPTITLLVAQKRHLTRLFPMNERDGGKSGNIPPGTVVDRTIIHPQEFDFYLNSHYGSLGTSKPTHYHVLLDQHTFSSDQLQRLVYNLCYTFPRCTKPISLVPPVYYADLVAYRGRLYYESLNDPRSPASTSSSSSSSPSTWSISSSPSFDLISFPKVHCDLENLMICI